MPQLRVRPLTLLALPFLLIASGCEDDDTPTGPSAGAGGSSGSSGSGGVAQVRGTERLAWNVSGGSTGLRFRAYVDGKPVDLTGATCTNARGDADCQAPLPTMSDGMHTIALVNVTISSGIESDRSAPITVQKVSARASVAALRLASSGSGALRVEPVVRIADGLAFTADIVATGVRAPAQLAGLPDGRLLVSDADGRVLVVRPDQPGNLETALDAGLLTSLAVGPMGLASHPDFAQNRFVYVSLLEQERPDRTRLRVVRLREVGDTLGEPATLLDVPVVESSQRSDVSLEAAQAGSRMAFGPDRLLYVMLPPGLEFVDEPAASRPRASMLRVADDGHATPGEPLSGITSTPLAFTWHQETGALLVMFRGESGEAAVKSFGGRARVSTSAEASADTQTMRAEPTSLRVRESIGGAAGTLLLQSATRDLLMALGGTRADTLKGIARLALPVRADRGSSDRIGDVVVGDGGTLFVVTNNGPGDAGVSGMAGDVVVRLKPLPASSQR